METFTVEIVFTCIAQKTQIKKHERICKCHGYCCVEMPKEDLKNKK